VELDDAIEAHAAWKQKLAVYLKKPGDRSKPAEIRADNRSELGQWLHGEGKRFSSLAEYSKLLTENARFHRAAAKLVERANAGQETSGEVAASSDSEFACASRDVIAAIVRLKSKVSSVPSKR
jgi:methyl-accepting chemotaxis protein